MSVIDTKTSTDHSSRSTSRSKTKVSGISTAEILKKVYLLNVTTFETFHNRTFTIWIQFSIKYSTKHWRGIISAMCFTFTADIAYRQFYRLNQSQWFNTPVHPSSNKHCFHIILSGCVFCGFNWGGGGKNWSKVKSEPNFKMIISELTCRALHTIGFILQFYSQIYFLMKQKQNPNHVYFTFMSLLSHSPVANMKRLKPMVCCTNQQCAKKRLVVTVLL